MDVVFHCNLTQPHQVEHGQWLSDGLKRHGLKLTVTPNLFQEADVHIVSGPHYAKSVWKHSRTILLDRAYYHEGKSIWKSMDWVSLGWCEGDGRRFNRGCGRDQPERKDRRDCERSIFLADFDGPVERADTVRLHPVREAPREGLLEVLSRHGIAIGYYTSALAVAGLEGLEVICKTQGSVMSYPNWLELLPYADWHYSEIQSGEAWQHLIETE